MQSEDFIDSSIYQSGFPTWRDKFCNIWNNRHVLKFLAKLNSAFLYLTVRFWLGHIWLQGNGDVTKISMQSNVSFRILCTLYTSWCSWRRLCDVHLISTSTNYLASTSFLYLMLHRQPLVTLGHPINNIFVKKDAFK